MEDLRIGNSILVDYIDLETEKQERAARSKKNEKASIEAAAEKVVSFTLLPVCYMCSIIICILPGQTCIYGR